jgi:thioester reductase-like protein
MEELNRDLDIAVAATDTPPCKVDLMESDEAWRLANHFGIREALKIVTTGRPTHAVYIC